MAIQYLGGYAKTDLQHERHIPLKVYRVSGSKYVALNFNVKTSINTCVA